MRFGENWKAILAFQGPDGKILYYPGVVEKMHVYIQDDPIDIPPFDPTTIYSTAVPMEFRIRMHTTFARRDGNVKWEDIPTPKGLPSSARYID